MNDRLPARRIRPARREGLANELVSRFVEGGSGVVFGQNVFCVVRRDPKTTPDPSASGPTARSTTVIALPVLKHSVNCSARGTDGTMLSPSPTPLHVLRSARPAGRRRAFWSLCLLGSLSIALATGSAAAEVATVLHAIRAEDIKVHIDVLADDAFEGREAGSRGGRAAGGYLAEQFEQYALRPGGERGTYFQEFRGNCRNVLAILEGSDPELREQYLVIGAHYDHVGYGNAKNSFGPIGFIHNGADDNASGVAGVLSVIQGFLALGEPPRRSILFAMWDGEGQGRWGSKHWTQNPTVPLEQVVFVLNADMIGHLRDDRLTVFGTRTARGLRQMVTLCNTMTDLVLDFTWELSDNSDHYSFFAQDIPVLMLHTGLHPYYHRPSDTADRINHQGAEQVTRLMFSLALELANQPHPPQFRLPSRYEGPPDMAELERPAAPRPPRLGVRLQNADDGEPRVYFAEVFPGLPADRAGLAAGDRIVRFAGQDVKSVDDLRVQIVAAASPVSVVVERGTGASRHTLNLPVSLDGPPLRLGISWREDDAEPGTVLVTEVVGGSAAYQAGLEVADRIYRVGGRRFANSDEFLERTRDGGGSLELLVERQGRLQTVTLVLPTLRTAIPAARTSSASRQSMASRSVAEKLPSP